MKPSEATPSAHLIPIHVPWYNSANSSSLSEGGPVSEKAPLTIRARLRVRVPAVPKQAAGIGALWVGLAGSSVSNKVAKARYFVCPVHRRRPRLEHLDVIAGKWTVDTQVCCRAFLTTLRDRLAGPKTR
jgi:hypothetical protein